MTAPTGSASDRELVLTRLIDAPREKLYQAWSWGQCADQLAEAVGAPKPTA